MSYPGKDRGKSISGKKEWNVQKLGGSRVSPKDLKTPGVSIGNSEGGQ